jgi:NAD(P)-dependent dehydrogenase (short-subunit alcohol dehydrogenase family)
MAGWIRHDEAALTQWASGVPAGRMGKPGEIADSAAFLASDGGSYFHGAVLLADGGVTALTGTRMS